jgi:hypothetical protein
MVLIPNYKRGSSSFTDDLAAKYVSQRPVEANLGKENTIQELRSWLDECLTAHPESLSPDGQSLSHRFPLPTRVIDVGTDTDPIAKIIQPSSVIHEQYITLSYCWGKQRFLTSVSANIAAHMERLPESNLPQTFTDAIDVTRRLGFRYLWIDALCIIQDSVEDKTIEIAAMGNIYSNSTLTIAVVGAAGVADGFLRTKPRLRVDIPYQCPDGILGTVKVSPQETVDLWQEPLYIRAWCLQENRLSPSPLVYQHRNPMAVRIMSYETPKYYSCSLPRRNPRLGSSPFARIPPLLPNPAPHDLDAPSSGDPALDATRYSIWKNFVQNYTRRKLTVPSDRLPAIVGISQKFKDAWSDEYCAGIWKRQFIPSLTWRRIESVEGPGAQYWPPLSEYRAPSWSWASIEGPIEFDYRFDLGNARGLGARLISCEVVPLRHQTPLGEVQSGKAVLEASLIPARDVPIRGYAGQDPESFRIGGNLTLDDHPKEWIGRAHLLQDELFDNAWAMLLGEGRYGSGKASWTTALILMPFLDETESFKRVGFWNSSVRGQSKLWVGAKKRRTVTIV